MGQIKILKLKKSNQQRLHKRFMVHIYTHAHYLCFFSSSPSWEKIKREPKVQKEDQIPIKYHSMWFPMANSCMLLLSVLKEIKNCSLYGNVYCLLIIDMIHSLTIGIRAC